MKTEKTSEEKSKTAEIEKQQFSSPQSEIGLEDAKNELLFVFKKMIDQGAAVLDFKKDETGEIESVTITRVLTGETLFHANKNSWTGRADINRILGLMNSGQPD